MSKPFTYLSAVVLLAVAAAHAYRLYAGLPVVFGDHSVPLWASWPGAIVAGVLGLMLFVEARR